LNVNTIQLGVVSTPSATIQPVTGILNVTGGTVVANDELVLGVPDGAGTASLADGDVNITNGVVEAADIIASGSVNSSITVSAGTLSLTSAAGSIGTMAAPVGSITLSAGTTLNLAVGNFPAVVASSLVASGTADTINLTALPLIPNLPRTNTLIQSLSGPISGYDFALGTPLPAGFKGYIQPSADGSAVQLVITNAPSFPQKGVTITSTSLQAGNLILSGTNGLANDVYYVLTSTNLISWTPIATNTFNSIGDFSVTLPYLSSESGRFYKIESQ
jgi:hypothetical protein